MINPVSSVSQVQNVLQTTSVKEKSAQPAPPPATSDTVQISSSAKAALQELNETSAQTAREAGKGDLQAQRLLARHAAEKAILDGNS